MLNPSSMVGDGQLWYGINYSSTMLIVRNFRGWRKVVLEGNVSPKIYFDQISRWYTLWSEAFVSGIITKASPTSLSMELALMDKKSLPSRCHAKGNRLPPDWERCHKNFTPILTVVLFYHHNKMFDIEHFLPNATSTQQKMFLMNLKISNILIHRVKEQTRVND